MAKGKKSFLFYTDWRDIFAALKPVDAGKLINHMLAYVNDENPEEPTGSLNLAWIPIKAQLKRDLKKWEQFVDKQKENGAKGGRPKSQKTQAFSKIPKKAVTVTDTVTVNDTVTEKEVGCYRQFAHLRISESEVSKLLDDGFTIQQIDDTLDSIQNYKGNKKYTSMYLTAKKWLKKDRAEIGQNAAKPSKLSGADEVGKEVDQRILEQIKASM